MSLFSASHRSRTSTPLARHAGASVLTLACRAAGAALLLSTAACSQFSVPFHIPFTGQKKPDLTPSRASADNLVRLDAQLRSGCDVVDNIERPEHVNPRSQEPQRWVARTCTGDISYDVVTVPGPNGPIVKVTPVPGPMNRPMNPNFKPAMPAEDAK